MGAQGQEDWFDEVMPGLDDGRPGGKRRFPWPGRHGKDDGDEAEARTRPRIGVRVGVATVIVTGLMVTAGLTAGMVSANRRERLADASAACERSARAWSAGSAAWGRDRDRIMGSVDLDALRATDPDMAGSLERLSSDPATPAGCTAGGDMATLDADAKRISKAADRLAKRSERLEKAVAKAGQTVGDAESSRARSRLEHAVADARGLLAGSTADQYKVPYLYTVGSDSSRNRRRGCSTTGPRPRRTWTGSPRASAPWSPRSPPARDDGPPYGYRSGARVYGQTDQETGRNRSCRVGQSVPDSSNAPSSRDQWGRADDAPRTRDRRRHHSRRVLSADVRPVPCGHAPRHARGPLA